jgi:hypothetical protein
MLFESKEKVNKSSKKFGNCPKILFWGNNDKESQIIVNVSDEQRFWVEYIVENPSTSFGGIKAKLTEIKLVKPKNIPNEIIKLKQDITLCGSVCKTCPSFISPCNGCPALDFS